MNIFNLNVFSLRSRASALAVVALLGLSTGLSGCKGSKGDPGAVAAAQPTGTIQGVLADNVTHQPIVGAVVDIGVATATTNADGQFVFRNVVVPVDAANNVNAAAYVATIDLRKVTSPVNMASATATPRYPDFHYKKINITFTSLYTSAASATTATPVTGLIANVDFPVGKLAATITGVVADNLTKQPVAAGYIVKLVSLDSWQPAATDTGMGATENVVGSTTTDASGNFTFANIESLQSFRIDAWNTAQTYRGTANVTAPADGETKTLSIQANNTVFLLSTDVLAPTVTSITPQQGTDQPAAATNVVFTFSEPILQTAATSTLPGTGLYNTVDVNYNGAKQSNISRSLAWSNNNTVLTVSLPALAASSKYSVSLPGTPAGLTTALGIPANANAAVLNDLSNLTVSNLLTKGAVSFTTNGSTTPAAPGTVTITNSTSLNANLVSSSVILNWAPVSGAKAYNVYRAENRLGSTGQLQLILPAVAVATPPVSTLTSDFTDALPAVTAALPYTFVSGQNKLSYTYAVYSVSADNTESALGTSPALPAQDNVAPTATLPVVVLPVTTYTITFNEPIDEVSATTLTNYVMAIGAGASFPAVTGVALNPALPTTSVIVTFATTPIATNILTVTGVKDIAGNAMVGATHTF